jgi:DNA-directed RNA polymerase subunit H (RpoH/RPB5)
MITKYSKYFLNKKYYLNVFIQNKYIISRMEKHVCTKEQEELKKVLTELNINESNMPDIPHKQPRLTRY